MLEERTQQRHSRVTVVRGMRASHVMGKQLFPDGLQSFVRGVTCGCVGCEETFFGANDVGNVPLGYLGVLWPEPESGTPHEKNPYNLI